MHQQNSACESKSTWRELAEPAFQVTAGDYGTFATKFNGYLPTEVIS